MDNSGPIVMVVDDDQSVRTSLSRLFRSSQIALRTFASGEAFLERAQLDSAACLIIDVHLLGMQGLELQQLCARRRPDLPIIMISAFNDDDAETRSLAAGARAFFHKPFQAAALLDAVKQLIRESQKRR